MLSKGKGLEMEKKVKMDIWNLFSGKVFATDFDAVDLLQTEGNSTWKENKNRRASQEMLSSTKSTLRPAAKGQLTSKVRMLFAQRKD